MKTFLPKTPLLVLQYLSSPNYRLYTRTKTQPQPPPPPHFNGRIHTVRPKHVTEESAGYIDYLVHQKRRSASQNNKFDTLSIVVDSLNQSETDAWLRTANIRPVIRERLSRPLVKQAGLARDVCRVQGVSLSFIFFR